MLKIYVDGASRNNPGHAAWAYLFVDGNKITNKKYGYIGKNTNNVAEYSAIINALIEAKKLSLDEIEVYSDSELVINQINGRYRVKQPHLMPLKAQVNSLKSGFQNLKFIKVSREDIFIKEADKLCNTCLDMKVG